MNPYELSWCGTCQDYTNSDNPTLFGAPHCTECGEIKTEEDPR